MMKPGLSATIIRAVAASLVLCASAQLAAQEKPLLGRIAALRMKNINMTEENKDLLKDVASKINAGLAGTKQFDVPSEEAILEALDDEGIDPKGLIDLDEYLEAGKSLKTDFIVIGSIGQKIMTFSIHARVYSVSDGSLKAVVEAGDAVDRLQHLVDVIVHRIWSDIETPVHLDSLYDSFAWSQEFRFSFGPERYDLAPPVVHYVNQNPPFEIALKADMDRLGGAYVVTNFDIFADDEPIAAVNPDVAPPFPLREHEVVINGHRFCFQADVQEVRGMRGRAFTSALMTIKARSCK